MQYAAFDFIKRKKSDLSKASSELQKVYLDINFWIDFLKVQHNLEVRPYTQELFELLTQLSKENKILIPISDIQIFESFKTKSDGNYKKIIKLMDQLSNSVCFVDFHQRLKEEIIFALRVAFGISDADMYLKESVWTKPFFLMKEKVPAMENLSVADENKKSLQMSFVDFAWEKNLSDIFINASFEHRDKLSIDNFENQVTKILFEGRDKYSGEFDDFEDLLGKEIYGSLELSKERIKDLLDDYFIDYEKGTSIVADSFLELKGNERENRMLIILTKSIIESKKYSILPSVTIGAGIHSLKRWEKNSKYKRTDAFDVMHAQVALPYCDYFFTERTLRGLIKDNHLKYDKEFCCEVLSNPKEAYDALYKTM